MDTKAIRTSLALVTIVIIFVLAENEVLIALTSAILLGLMVDGFISMSKEVKAIMEADKNDIRKGVFKWLTESLLKNWMI